MNQNGIASCSTLYRLELDHLSDEEIFNAARLANVALITKDRDLVDLVQKLGSPPQIIWVRCGNSSNQNLIRVFQATFQDCLELIDAGEEIVEIRDAT